MGCLIETSVNICMMLSLVMLFQLLDYNLKDINYKRSYVFLVACTNFICFEKCSTDAL